MGFFCIMTLIKDKIASLFTDIRFWILLLFLIRLIGITNPPADVAHNWRQTTVNMVARNYYETDSDFLYPTLDFGGERTGIAPMEAPVLNYSIYLVSEVFGFKHWYGRLINLIISSIGIWFFFKLLLLYFNKKTALYASIILLFSVWFTFSRKIMPDTFACSLMIMGLYHGFQYFKRKKKLKEILLYAFFITIGVAAKLPVGFYLIVLTPILIKQLRNWKVLLPFCVISILALLPSYFWYFKWNPYLSETYLFDHFFLGKDVSTGFKELIADGPQTMSRFYDTALKYSGFILFLAGLIYTIVKKQTKSLIVLTLGSIGFAIIMLKSGHTFSHHSYYIIPFVPFMALVAGQFLSEINKAWLTIAFLSIFIIETSLNHQDDFRIRQRLEFITHLEQDIKPYIPADAKIGINCYPNPTPMYFAHRKGWLLKQKHLTTDAIDERKLKGMDYLIRLKTEFKTSKIPLDIGEILYSNDDFDIIKL
jgi:4-amino-4-deoxy-L-arabinose transferase-like glycosyltransferase